MQRTVLCVYVVYTGLILIRYSREGGLLDSLKENLRQGGEGTLELQ